MEHYSITQWGKPLSHDKYRITLSRKEFISNQNNLVLNFAGCHGWSFEVGNDCTFVTSSGCSFKTGIDCTFITGNDCMFETGDDCVFNTCRCCIFDSGDNCVFSLWKIDTCRFIGGSGVILDRSRIVDLEVITGNVTGNKYQLNEEFLRTQKLLWS